MHVVDGMDGINDRFLANELAPIPGQSGSIQRTLLPVSQSQSGFHRKGL